MAGSSDPAVATGLPCAPQPPPVLRSLAQCPLSGDVRATERQQESQQPLVLTRRSRDCARGPESPLSPQHWGPACFWSHGRLRRGWRWAGAVVSRKISGGRGAGWPGCPPPTTGSAWRIPATVASMSELIAASVWKRGRSGRPPLASSAFLLLLLGVPGFPCALDRKSWNKGGWGRGERAAPAAPRGQKPGLGAALGPPGPARCAGSGRPLGDCGPSPACG